MSFWYWNIRLSEKFLSFYKEIIDAQRFSFYIILSNYIRSILLCWDKHRDISLTWFHVCMKVHCWKRHVCERKTLFGQSNISLVRFSTMQQKTETLECILYLLKKETKIGKAFFIYKSSNYLKRSKGKNILIYTMRQWFRCCLDFLTTTFTLISLNVNKTRNHGFWFLFHISLLNYARTCRNITKWIIPNTIK